jgi:hypothetical protein
MRRSSQILVVLGITQLCLIPAFYFRTRAIHVEAKAQADAYSSSVSAVNPTAQRLATLTSENTRLKNDLTTIDALKLQAKRLDQEIAATTVQTDAAWSAESNRLQSAIETSRARITDLENWEKERNRAELRKLAAARLAQKAQENSRDPADEKAQLESTFNQIAAGMRAQLEARREWAKMEKTPENREMFKSRLGAAWSNFDQAHKSLGPDSALFEDLPMTPDSDASSTPLLRSVLPDLQGVTATVYLDGRVEWSPTPSVAK